MHPIREDEDDVLARLEARLEYVSGVIARLKDRNAKLEELLRETIAQRDQALAEAENAVQARSEALAEAHRVKAEASAEAERVKAEAFAEAEKVSEKAMSEAEQARAEAARLVEEADSLRSRQREAASRIKSLLTQMEQMDLLTEN